MFAFRCAFVFFDFGWFFDPASSGTTRTTNNDRLRHRESEGAGRFSALTRRLRLDSGRLLN
jgi:hypothetical protein